MIISFFIFCFLQKNSLLFFTNLYATSLSHKYLDNVKCIITNLFRVSPTNWYKVVVRQGNYIHMYYI